MVISSTIDKIKDTTIMRQIRKLAGVIDEQNASIEAVNDKLDNFDISGVETDISNLKKTVGQVEISTEENTTHLTTVDSTLDNHAREIATIKTKDVSQDTEIQGLSESVVSDLTGQFNNDTRTLKLSIERESAPSIDCNVVIPSGGTTGEYTSGNGINIDSNNVITTKIDNSTIKINDSGEMYSVGGGSGGKTYTAGNGIAISTSDVISVDTTVVATKTDISDMETKTNANGTFATKTEFNTLKRGVGDAIKPIDIVTSANALTIKMASLDGQENTKVIPKATASHPGLLDAGDYDTVSLLTAGVAEGLLIDQGLGIQVPVDNVTIRYNDDNNLEVIGGGGSSSKKFTEIDTNYASASQLLNYLITLDVGTMLTIYLFGKTASSPCGTLTGIVKSKETTGDKKISITYTGGNFYNGSELVVVGAINYNVQPYFNINSDVSVDLWIPELKGNAVSGKTYDMSSSFQGYSVAVFN